MKIKHINPARGLGHEEQIHEAVLRLFCDPLPKECLCLAQLSSSEWPRLLTWLDVSGLALYFIDRLTELGFLQVLPPEVYSRLQCNLADNALRMTSMMAEQTAIQEEFKSAAIRYAVLKGFSLWPISVPRPELRSQLDLDFLVLEQCAPEARRILEARGYYLHAISGNSWEFKKNAVRKASLENLYKDIPHRSVELHLESAFARQNSRLARAERRSIGGVSTPVLSPVDLFLDQALHVYKHVCSEFSRAAHLIEFWRHVMARRDDRAFWTEVRAQVEVDRRAAIGLGVVTLIMTRVMGSFAPEELAGWTVAVLPPSARLWVEIYGCRSALSGFPGTKLHLLLQRELASSGIPAKRSLRRVLLPLRLPPAIARGAANESYSARLQRYWLQIFFVLFRLRFHTVEGVRYLVESLRWKQYTKGVAS